MTTKDRAYLKGLAMKIDPVLSLGKSSLTPEFVAAADEALTARELIKSNVLKNCEDDINELARTLAERSRSEVVQVIGRKIVLYKRNRDDIKIVFPGEKLHEKKAPEKKPAKKPAVKPAAKRSSEGKFADRKTGFKKSFDKKAGAGKYDKRK